MRVLVMFVLWCITPGQPLSYPVFGTKRYHRASGSSAVPSSAYVSSPHYNSMPQYYDQRQTPYFSPGYDQNGYVSENGYYYYPRHEYQSYGMPTYRGEYKPSPYYYAPGPSYNYYDDRDVASNPLDDLHEEILQEDERERQREIFPVGQESWYENSKHQDDLTNNFLRNLIAYNRQMDAEQQEEQLQKEQPIEYDEYSEMNPVDYEYDPNDDGLYDLKSYENQQVQHNKFNEMEDEAERQLKKLARVNQQQHNNKNHDELSMQPENFNKWQHSHSSYANYDADPEYDDAWINWDRKRSHPKRLSIKRDESIKDFTNRKPFPIVKPTEVETSTKPISTTTTNYAEAMTTTSKPKNGYISGQKEIVLPRPATPAQHIFSQPVLDIIDDALQTDKQESNEESKRPKDVEKSSNIYDTIKELVALQEHLEKSSENTKHQKRFVSSEESLVRELNSLKRQTQ